MAEQFELSICDGKYHYIYDGGRQQVFRNDQIWQVMNESIRGNKFVFSLAVELHEARRKIIELEEALAAGRSTAEPQACVDRRVQEPSAATVRRAGYAIQTASHDASVGAGWWRDLATGVDFISEVRNNTRLGRSLVAEKLMLIVSEVAEAMEGHRKNLQDDKLPHRPAIEVELADAVIRIGDLAGALGLDLGAAIVEKLAYNAQRADHKPENRAQPGGKAY